LDRAYADDPSNDPVDRALAALLRREHIPRALPEAFLEGLAWDAEGRRYETIDDVCAYAARVAGTVGVMMTLLMGPRGPRVVARACDLGVAMQLTNIARDVGEDAARGRIYLPLAWMREAGVDPEAWLARPAHGDGIARTTARILETADAFYRRADLGVPSLPADCRVAIRAARLIYSDIGRAIAKNRYDSVSRRARVTAPRKVWLVARALVARGGSA
jgi:phytoene synthase